MLIGATTLGPMMLVLKAAAAMEQHIFKFAMD
jgi:hypothetical protein